MTTDNKARIIPVSAGSYCNDPDNLLAANAPDQRLARSFQPTALPVGIFMADRMVLCGGNLNPNVVKILCFYYETRYPGWLDVGVWLLPNPSKMSATTFPNGSTWLLGGISHETSEPLLETNVLTPDRELLKSFDLPLKTEKLCAVALSDMQVFIADGIGGRCFLYDSKVDENTGSKWTELPNLPATRPDEVLCALAKNNGDPLVIVDGWTHNERTHPTHIFHVASQTWSNAQGDGEYIFPFSSGLFTHGQTVLSAAGYVKGEDGSRQVNKWNRAFDVNTGNWLTVGNPVDSVGGAVHIPLPKSFGACKPKK
ncbi:uncharacterized protein LOC131890131 [Tigriopus californicus]|uniref:uncharacterized protein LOC131890131 n=1 Tax=Tigriopus californicus TaxID=6832 RepID=UPI0027D9EC19|nr:uncharacterized protein LOC131890131 [Tigriopus californicus]